MNDKLKIHLPNDSIWARLVIRNQLPGYLLQETFGYLELYQQYVGQAEDYCKNLITCDFIEPTLVNANSMIMGLLIESILQGKVLITDVETANRGLEEVLAKLNKLNLLDNIDLKLYELDQKLEKLDLIISKLDNIIEKLNRYGNQLIEMIRNIQTFLNALEEQMAESLNILRQVLERIEDMFAKVEDVYDRLIYNFTNRWNEFNTRLKNGIWDWVLEFKRDSLPQIIEEYWQGFQDNITKWWETFKQEKLPQLGEEFWQWLNAKLTPWWINAQRDIVGVGSQPTPTLSSLSIALREVEVEVAAGIEESARGFARVDAIGATVALLTAQTTGIAFIAGLTLTNVKKTMSQMENVYSNIHEFYPSLKGYFDEKFDTSLVNIDLALTQYQINHRDEIIQLIQDAVEGVISANKNVYSSFGDKNEITKYIADEVCNRIVGESYYRWDSVTSYYPTIIFKFKEEGEQRPLRHSQIKLRYNKLSQDITDQDVEEIKQEVQRIAGLSYNYGDLRVNFVSKSKHTKTTIFVSTEDEAIRLLVALCKVAKIEWSSHDLTYTKGRRRLSITRRSLPLSGVLPYENAYNETFTIKLFRVVFIVNGLEKPLLIYEEYP
jgi:hypothetical protein